MRRTLVALLTVGALAPFRSHGQGSSPIRTLFSSDTMGVSMPVVSPDGRWLVFVRTVSNQERRLMIRPMAGGKARDLFAEPGTHSHPMFTPRGDRLVFASSLPRRERNDVQSYLVVAPFDTRTGTLTSAPRQLTLDPVRAGPMVRPVISPDGQSVAYVPCCSDHVLKIIPTAGGNARTLAVSEGGAGRGAPTLLTWTLDNRSLTYVVRAGEASTWYRIPRDGGAPTVIGHMPNNAVAVSPDGKYYVTIDGRVRWTLRIHSADGRELASTPSPRLLFPSLSPDGRYLLAGSDNATATIKVVPVAGGPTRTVGRGQGYEWPEGWSPDGQVVQISEEEHLEAYLRLAGLDGSTKARIALREGEQLAGVMNGQLIIRTGKRGDATGWTIIAQSIADGSRKVLAKDVVFRVCCEPVSPGGMYYGIVGDEFYYREVHGDRMQIRGMRADGTSRLLAEVPRRLLGVTGFGIARDRVAYLETVGDSTRVQVVNGPGRPPLTIATLPRSPDVGEFTWSHDGRMLSLYVNSATQPMTIFRFDESGKVAGAPQTFSLPFEYYYETFWLPDNSGLTMIAQPRGAANTEVALVKLSDPQHPMLLTKDDPTSKWGHALSPDGKYIAYPSEQSRGSSIQMVDISELLKRAGAP